MTEKTAFEKFQDVLKEREKGEVARLRKKHSDTHVVIGSQVCMNGYKGKKVPATRVNPETKQVEQLTVPVIYYNGWDHNNRYSGAKLREIRNQQVEQLIKDNPDLKVPADRIIDSNTWNNLGA